MRPQKSQTPGADNQHSAPLPSSPPVPVAPTHAHDEQYARASHQHEAAKDWWAEVFPNIAIAAFTLALTVVAWFQWRTSGKQADTTRDALLEARRAADAAKDSADIAREALHLAERADVLFDTHKSFDMVKQSYTEGEIHPTTSIVIVHRNFGRTRADSLRIRWRLYVEGDPVPDTPFLPPIVLGGGAVIETRILPTIGDVTGDRYNLVGSGVAILKALGELTYVDIFGKPHHAIFRGTFRPTLGAFAVDTESADNRSGSG